MAIMPAEDAAPAGARVEPGWRALRVAGPLSFELTGVLAALAGPLTEAGVPILQNVPLARGLNERVELDDYIDGEFFDAVAEVLFWAETVRRERGEDV